MAIEYIYNISTNSTNLVELMQNVQAEVPFSQLTLLAFAIVSFIFLSKRGYKEAFAGSSFLTFLMALLLYSMRLLNTAYLTGAMVLLGISVIALLSNKD